MAAVVVGRALTRSFEFHLLDIQARKLCGDIATYIDEHRDGIVSHWPDVWEPISKGCLALDRWTREFDGEGAPRCEDRSEAAEAFLFAATNAWPESVLSNLAGDEYEFVTRLTSIVDRMYRIYEGEQDASESHETNLIMHPAIGKLLSAAVHSS
jgi:hypothetical protein